MEIFAVRTWINGGLKMKRFFGILVIAVLGCGMLVGCKKNENGNTSNNDLVESNDEIANSEYFQWSPFLEKQYY